MSFLSFVVLRFVYQIRSFLVPRIVMFQKAVFARRYLAAAYYSDKEHHVGIIYYFDFDWIPYRQPSLIGIERSTPGRRARERAVGQGRDHEHLDAPLSGSVRQKPLAHRIALALSVSTRH